VNDVDPTLYSVFLEQSAFKNIVIHTAEYAHFNLKVKSWKECYGFLVGYIDKETKWTHITDAIPMTHGTHFGVEFKNEHYILAAYLNHMIAENGEFFVGWYHSHPGLGLFLSQTDIINQLGYQIVNEKAIALVFDHTKIITKEPPIQVFQLDNPAFGASSAYHPIEYYIGGIKKNEEFENIRDFYYKIEADVIAGNLGSIEKTVKNRVQQWRKATKIELPESQIYKKGKRRRGGKKLAIPK
jgi:proteasome lid subunit RPN8/RPN11